MGNKINNWFKRNAAALALASSRVEKNALGQEAKPLEDEDSAGVVNPQQQNSVMSALQEGEVTEEVQQLRWRMYKIDREADRYQMEFKYNADTGEMTYGGASKVENYKKKLQNDRQRVQLEPSDQGELDLVFKNKSMGDRWDWSDYDENTSKTVEEITKEEVPLQIEREHTPTFFIENYTDSVYIRDLDGVNKLIEFFIPKYPDYQSNIQIMFIKGLEKAKRNSQQTDFLEFDKIGFITNRASIGTEYSKAYSYNIGKFYKIVEFGSYYVVKFLGSVETEDEDIFEKYRHEELDKKYENKERKDTPLEINPGNMEGDEGTDDDIGFLFEDIDMSGTTL